MYFLEQKLTQNKTASAFLKKAFQRYFIDAMGAMALGLFSSLIIGLILSQLSKFSFLGFLEPYAAMVSASSPVVGAAIGVAIAQGLKSKPLVLFSCAVSGAYGYAVGGPVGAYIGAVFGAEIGGAGRRQNQGRYYCQSHHHYRQRLRRRPAGRPWHPGHDERFGRCHQFRHPTHPFSHGYSGFGHRRHGAHRTDQFSGLMYYAGSQRAGRRRGSRGLLLSDGGLCRSQLPGKRLGRSDQPGHRYFYAAVFQYYAPSADLDCTHIGLGSAGSRFHLPVSNDNTASGAGMGTSGLVGQFGAFAAMGGGAEVWFQVILMHFVLPAVLSFLFDWCLRKIGWVKDGYMKIS